MTRRKKILLFVTPATLLFALIYPHLPWKGLGLCAVRRMINLNCPGCGFIRSIAALVSGDLRASIDLNPMGVVALVLLVALWFKEFVAQPLFKKRCEISVKVVRTISLSFVAGLFIQWFCYLII
jgi:hypothetical protein